MSQQVRSDYLAAVAKINDESMRAAFLLLLGVMDEISKKLDNVMADEKGLREAVLNGHSETHDDDHEWIKNQRKLDCHEICMWARTKMREEEASAQVKTNRIHKVIDKAAEHSVTVLLTGIALYFGFIK